MTTPTQQHGPHGPANDHVLRPFSASEDYQQCVELQRLTWGRNFTECVPPSILQIAQKVGGVAAGAFDGGGRLGGFVFGVSGFRHGRTAHWSHMLAVRPELRGTGLGKRLKGLQRDLLLQHGVEIAYWTYDPLVSANAHLNINRLRALPDEYVPDMYGSDTGSELHSGLGTDRFIVQWELEAQDVADALAGKGEAVSAEPREADSPAVNLDDRLEPTTDMRESTEDTVRIAIPADIQAVKQAAADTARTWRSATRHAFQTYLGRGYRVTGFARSDPGETYYYIMKRNETPSR